MINFNFLSRGFIHRVCSLQLLKDKGEDAKKIGIMVASHNEDTVRFAIERMKEIGVSPEDKVICFGQLLGMCDYITMPLGNFLLLHVANKSLKIDFNKKILNFFF